MKRALNQSDPAFENLLQSTQALAKNIQQAHKQQRNFPVQPAPQPPAANVFLQQGACGFLHDDTQSPPESRTASYDNPQAGGSVSLDSDMAFDGIEELLLIDSILDDSKHSSNLSSTPPAAVAPEAPPQFTQTRLMPGNTSSEQLAQLHQLHHAQLLRRQQQQR